MTLDRVLVRARRPTEQSLPLRPSSARDVLSLEQPLDFRWCFFQFLVSPSLLPSPPPTCLWLTVSHRPWNYNPNPDESSSQTQQQPFNPSQPAYNRPTQQQPYTSSANQYPRLPVPAYAQSRHHSTAGHTRPQQYSTPSASLHAALREGADFLPRPSIVPRLPPLSRLNSTPTQQSSFGYIPNHFFYSPPQSPQEPDPPHHTTNTNPVSSSSAQPFAGPSYTNQFAGPSIPNPLANPSAATQSTPRFDTQTLAAAFRGDSSHLHSHNTLGQQHIKEEDLDTMPPPTSASTAAASRKRARPSFSSGTPPSATKRRLNPDLIELDDTDEDEIEELGPDNDILAKEREALVTKQREESNKVNRMGELNCMICLEHFTNMTATHCGMYASVLPHKTELTSFEGHIFCHECLTQALIASQRNSDHNYGTCPACRKPIKPKGKTQIVPLTLMKARKK